jgi:hypothetical protein
MTLDNKPESEDQQLKGFFSQNVFTSILPGEVKKLTFVAK